MGRWVVLLGEYELPELPIPLPVLSMEVEEWS